MAVPCLTASQSMRTLSVLQRMFDMKCTVCGQLLKGAAIVCTCLMIGMGGEAEEPVQKVYPVVSPRAEIVATASTTTSTIFTAIPRSKS
jgi:hypothetical protein